MRCLRLRIAILGPVFSKSYFGGVATFNENLAYGFKLLGHEAVIYSNQNDIKPITKYGIRVSKVNNIETDCYDLVIASLIYLRYIKRFKSKNKVFFLHGFYYMPEEGLLKTFGALAFQQYYIKYCNYVIANSEFTRFINKYAYNIDSCGSVKLGVSYNFIEYLNAVGNKYIRKKNTILFCGRLVRAKLVEVILYALKYLIEISNESFYLTIVGDGPEKSNLMNYTKAHKLPVLFSGTTTQEDIVRYYLENDIFISLNPAEPFGITFCEALLAGCKIICPKTGGQVEHLSNYKDRVRMVDVDNHQNIAKTIKELARLDIGDLAKECINKYSYENTAREIIDLLSK